MPMKRKPATSRGKKRVSAITAAVAIVPSKDVNQQNRPVSSSEDDGVSLAVTAAKIGGSRSSTSARPQHPTSASKYRLTTTPSPPPAVREDTPSREDLPASAGPDAASWKKIPRKADKLHLPQTDEQLIADWYQDHPILYDRTRRDYKDVHQKSCLFQDMAVKLSVPCTGPQLKTWLESMRTSAGKLLKSGPSGTAKLNPTEKVEWVIRNFGFLENHIKRVPSRQAVSLKSKLKKRAPLPDLCDDSSSAVQVDSSPEQLEDDSDPPKEALANTDKRKRKNISTAVMDLVTTAQHKAAELDHDSYEDFQGQVITLLHQVKAKAREQIHQQQQHGCYYQQQPPPPPATTVTIANVRPPPQAASYQGQPTPGSSTWYPQSAPNLQLQHQQPASVASSISNPHTVHPSTPFNMSTYLSSLTSPNVLFVQSPQSPLK